MTQTRNQITIQALAFASQLLPAIIGVGSFMLLVRATTPVVLGEYIVYLTAVVLFEMVKSGGLQSALVMRVSTDNKEHQLRIIGSAYWLGGLFAIAVSLILITLFLQGFLQNNPAFRFFVAGMLCWVWLPYPCILRKRRALRSRILFFCYCSGFHKVQMP
ncbi:hypothetical protein ACFFJX_26490 [Pseudarcicella hirudinis]|uniref:hypothetical protein n=1 Tax=Pseudarcicella hirudinis TaxID=1079859 RepID=UPI0035E7278C